MLKLLLLIFWFRFASSSNILGVFGIPAQSHHRALYPIFEKLAKKGNNVTVITAFPAFNKSLRNFHEIDISFTIDIHDRLSKEYYTRSYAETPYIEIMSNSFTIFIEAFQEVLASTQVQTLLETKLDVILVESLMPLPFCVGIKNKAPIIGMISLPGILFTHDAMGNPLHPILSPNVIIEMSEGSSKFFERLTSVMFNLALRFYYRFFVTAKCDKIARKYYGDDIPSLREIENNMSLVFTTTNWVQNEIVPLVPGIVDLSLIHIKKIKTLPKDIKDFFDKSKRGVIYFSLGTYQPTYDMCQHKMELIQQVLSSLPYDVLWKTNINTTMSSNILVKNWVPQNDVLAHPNLKVFITQGGAQSLEESIYSAVPVVLLPMFGDQGPNSRRIASKGMGIHLDIFTVTKEKLAKTIIEVAETKKYKENALKLSKILQDQPMKGVDKAVWWVEYIIRHQGAPHLKSGFIGMPFYQYYMLDVITFFILIIMSILFVIFKVFCWFIFFKKNGKIKTQ